MFGTKVETGLVAYDSVIAALGALLDDYELDGLTIKYLKPDKTARLAQVVQTLELSPVDLGQHTQIATDRFHDVALF